MNATEATTLADNGTTSEVLLSDMTTLFEQAWEEWDYYYQRSASLYHHILGIAQVLVCLIGLITNLLSITVLSMTIRRSKLPVYRCFLGLAIADLMAVMFTLIHSATSYSKRTGVIVDEIDIANYSAKSIGYNIVLELVKHLMNFAFCASNWCVVAMSILRCSAVFKPLWYQRHCTAKVVNILILLVYLFSLAVVTPSMSFIRFNSTMNRFHYERDKHDEAGLDIIEMVAIQFIPLITTAMLLVPLVWKLCSHSSIERAVSNAEYRSKDKMQSSITLVCIATFFVVCITPTMVFYCMRTIEKLVADPLPQPFNRKDHHNEIKTFIAQQFLVTINYTANFFFYIVLNARLRRKLKLLLRCSREGKRDRHLACITQQSSLSVSRGQGEAIAIPGTNGWTNRNPSSTARQPQFSNQRRQRMSSNSIQKTNLSSDTSLDRRSILRDNSLKSIISSPDQIMNVVAKKKSKPNLTNNLSLSNIDEHSAENSVETDGLLRKVSEHTRSGSDNCNDDDGYQVVFDIGADQITAVCNGC